MRKTLGAIGLLLLLAAGVVVNSLTPTPSVKAREAVWDAFETKANKNEPLAKVYWKGFNPIGYEKIPFNVLLIPSLGREASDFNELANGLNDDGNRVFLFDPRGLHGEPLPDSPTLEHFAEPITDINWENNPFPTVLIGHAFGNRVARMAASKNPNDITAVILLAAGGQTPMPPKAEQSLKNIFNPLRTYRSRMKDMHYAFFAEGNDIPDYWTRGWHTKTAMAQAKAVANSADDESWHCAGGVPMLIIQPMQDRIAPIENAYVLRDKCPQEVEIVEVQYAGHALLPEQPEAVAKAVLDFLAKHHPIPLKNKDTP